MPYGKGFTVRALAEPSDLGPVPARNEVFLELNWGRWLRPVLRPAFWRKVNPWFQATPDTLWFTLNLPMAGPLIGVRLFGYGFYFGFKRFALHHPEYLAWLPSAGGRYVTEAGDIAASTQNGHNRISLGTPIPTPATTDLSIRVLDINGTAPAKITAALHGTLITNPKAGPTSGMT